MFSNNDILVAICYPDKITTSDGDKKSLGDVKDENPPKFSDRQINKIMHAVMFLDDYSILSAIYHCDEITEDENDETIEDPLKFSDHDVKRLIRVINCEETSDEVVQSLKEEMRELGHPTGLESATGEKISVDLIKAGVIYYQQYVDTGRTNLVKLHFACVCGCYDALHEQAEIYQEKLKESKSMDDLVDLLVFLNRFGALYWSVGYEESCAIYMNLAEHFEKECENKLMEKCYVLAAKSYILAKDFANDPHSIEHFKLFYPEEGIDECAHKQNWPNFKDEEKVVMSHLPHLFQNKLEEKKFHYCNAETTNPKEKVGYCNSTFRIN